MADRRLVTTLLIVFLAAAAAGCSDGGAPAPTASRPLVSGQAAASALPATTAAGQAPVPKTAATQAPPAAPRTLTVFAAASLTESFNDLGKQFEAANPGVKVVFGYAGSQQLSAQLVQGAPADVFASANTKEMLTAISGGVVISGTQKTFARNRLAVIFPKDNPARIGALSDLAKAGLKLDVADKSVPVGQYTLDMLAKMSKDPAYGVDFQARALKNVVSFEVDVKAVVSKVSLGEVDAGIVYTTDASAAAGKLGSLAIPDQFNQIATYPIAPIARARQPELARQFVAFVLSEAGQQTVARYGFITNP